MSAFSFKTIKGRSEGIYREKGSKFMAFVFPARDEVFIKEKLTELRKAYFDANHCCFAYVLGPDKKKFRAFDDGEPNHSAGDPILGQIRSFNLTNVLVVVVRYFGGTKLGVGGLIAAYKTAAGEALSKAVVIVEEVTVRYALHYGYGATAEVMRMVKEFELEIQQENFGDTGYVEVSCKVRNQEKFLARLNLMIALKVELQWEEK